MFRRHWKPGFGSVSVDELVFIRDLIERHRPARFLEIGMASGLSTGFIARFLDAAGGKAITSIDHDDTFFGDATKPNGFLFDEIYPGGKLDAKLLKFKTALDADALGGPWDMAFIDANHAHPWPTLDTLAIAPHMTAPRCVIHHDLDLYMRQDVMFGIGPKYLYDQFPHDKRHASTANRGNIFCLDLGIPREELEDIAIRSLKLPWSLRTPLPGSQISGIRSVLQTHYAPRLLEHFDRCLSTMNLADRFRSGL